MSEHGSFELSPKNIIRFKQLEVNLLILTLTISHFRVYFVDLIRLSSIDVSCLFLDHKRFYSGEQNIRYP